MQAKKRLPSGTALPLCFLFAAGDLCSKRGGWRHPKKSDFFVAKTKDLSIRKGGPETRSWSG
jgi:hypothetical protein